MAEQVQKEVGLTSVDDEILIAIATVCAAVVMTIAFGMAWVSLGNLLAQADPNAWYVAPVFALWSTLESRSATPLFFAVLIPLIRPLMNSILQRFDRITIPVDPLLFIYFASLFIFGVFLSRFFFQSGLGYPFAEISQEQYDLYRWRSEQNRGIGGEILQISDLLIMAAALAYLAIAVGTALQRVSAFAHAAAVIFITAGLCALFAAGSQALLVSETRQPWKVQEAPLPWTYNFDFFRNAIEPEFERTLVARGLQASKYREKHPEVVGSLKNADSFLRTQHDGALVAAGYVSFTELIGFYAHQAVAVMSLDIVDAYGIRLTALQHNPARPGAATAVFIFRLLIVVAIAPIIYWFLGLFFASNARERLKHALLRTPNAS